MSDTEQSTRTKRQRWLRPLAGVASAALVIGMITVAAMLIKTMLDESEQSSIENAKRVEIARTAIAAAKWDIAKLRYDTVGWDNTPSIVGQVRFGTCTINVAADYNKPTDAWLVFKIGPDPKQLVEVRYPITTTQETLKAQRRDFGLGGCFLDNRPERG